MSNSVCVLAQVSSLARLLYCSLTVVATPVFLSCVRMMTRPILVPVRVNCWNHCSNDPAVPTGWDWLPYSEACCCGGGAEVFRSQNSHSPDWVLLDVWSLPWKTCPTVSRREGDWSGRCSRWLKKKTSSLCKESNYLLISQKVSVQEYFLGNVAQKSQPTDTGSKSNFNHILCIHLCFYHCLTDSLFVFRKGGGRRRWAWFNNEDRSKCCNKPAVVFVLLL